MKLGENNDIEVYLEASGRMAEATKWPKDQWTFFIRSYLSRETLVTLKALDKPKVANYGHLK